MAVLRVFKGSMLEENIARTAGSIGESRGGGRGVHTARVLHRARLEPPVIPEPGLRAALGAGEDRLLEIHRADGGGQRPGRAVRFAGPARDGGGSRTAVPRIGGGVGDSQGRAARRKRPSICSTTSPWARRIYLAGRVQRASRRIRISSSAWASWDAACCAWAGGHHQTPDRGRRFHLRGAQRQPGLHRRRLHHRTGTGGAEFLRQRDGVGSAGSAVDVLPGPAVAELPAGGRHRRELAVPAERRLALHRAARSRWAA